MRVHSFLLATAWIAVVGCGAGSVDAGPGDADPCGAPADVPPSRIEDAPVCGRTAGGGCTAIPSLDSYSPATDALREVRTVVTSEAYVRSLAVYGDSIFWTSEGSQVRRAPLKGGAATTIASGSLARTASSIAVDPSWVYWTNAGAPAGRASLVRAHHDGTCPTPLVAWVPLAFVDIILDDTHAWFTDGKRILRVAKGGGVVVALATASSDVTALALDDAYVYWTESGTGSFNDGALRRTRKTCDSTTTLASGFSYPSALVRHGDNLYFFATVKYQTHLFRLPTAGGCPTVLASPRDGAVRSMAVADDGLWWTTSYSDQGTGEVFTLPLAGGPIRQLTRRQYDVGLGAITLAPTAIFWRAEKPGSILSVAR